MPAGLPVALLFAAQAAAAPAAVQPAPAAECPSTPDPKAGPIVICAPKTQGYRLDPDVLEARREKKNQAGRPHNPHEAYRDKGCVIGPMGCPPQPAINLLAAAATAAEMGARLAKGQEIGSMFQTTPEPSEYQLYLAAKKRREEKEAEAAAEKARAAAVAAQAQSRQ